MMFFSKEVYIKSQLNFILLSRPLGATRCCSSLYDHIYKVPAHYCIMTRPLGATLVIVFYEYKAITSPRLLQAWQPGTWGLHMWNIQFWLMTKMNNLDFFQVITFILKQVLSHHFVSAQDLAATGNMDIREKKSSHSQFWVNQIDPASPITMTLRRQQLWPGVINIYKPDILAMINR